MIHTNHHSDFLPIDADRFAHQLWMPDIGLDGQTTLRDTRVLVVGCGALGSIAAWYLAASGIGTLALSDGDTVAIHNLHRQVLYRPDDCGVKKTQVLRNRLKEFAPFITVNEYSAIIADNADMILRDFDYVVDGTDNSAAKFLLNDVCAKYTIPLVYGSVYRLEGQCALFPMHSNNVGHPTTLRTLFPQEPNADAISDCAGSGTLGTVTSMIALWQAHLLIAHRLRWQGADVPRLFLWDMKTMQQTSIALEQESVYTEKII